MLARRLCWFESAAIVHILERGLQYRIGRFFDEDRAATVVEPRIARTTRIGFVRMASGHPMPLGTEFQIRSEWMFQVRSACQQFGCRIYQADRSQFELAVDDLPRTLAAADTLQEAVALRDLLALCSARNGTTFHQDYHRRRPDVPCTASPVEATLHVWSLHHDDPRVTWARWGSAFLSAFDATHPSSPGERAAAILRARFQDPPNLTELAELVGTSKTVLTSDFGRRTGMSPGEYLTRFRLRRFVDEMRKPGVNAGRLAEHVGYASYHNLLDAFRERTGFKPSAVRGLSDNDVRELVDVGLALSQNTGDACHRKFSRS